LLRAEARRIVHRRFLQILLLGLLVGSVTAVIIMSFQFAKTTPDLLAQADQQRAAAAAQQNQSRADCIKALAPGLDPDQTCGPVATPADFGEVVSYLPQPPYDFATRLPELAGAIGALLAAVAFLSGATWVGSEWSHKTMVALLLWEPRRVRVITAKVAILLAAAAVMAVLAQLAWTGASYLLGSVKGTTAVPADFWGGMLAMQARIVLLVVLAALAGFALANLLHNTGAALGVAFLVLALVETAVRALKPAWQPWLITENAVALVQPNGLAIPAWPGSYDGEPTLTVLSNWRGGLFLTAVVAVVLLLGGALFVRRDLT
jgi:ABC-type transport system involved in multi-copper enzyme maturation permease subunit